MKQHIKKKYESFKVTGVDQMLAFNEYREM